MTIMFVRVGDICGQYFTGLKTSWGATFWSLKNIFLES